MASPQQLPTGPSLADAPPLVIDLSAQYPADPTAADAPVTDAPVDGEDAAQPGGGPAMDGGSGDGGDGHVEGDDLDLDEGEPPEGVIKTREFVLPLPTPTFTPAKASKETSGGSKSLMPILIAIPLASVGLLGAVWLLKKLAGGGNKKKQSAKVSRGIKRSAPAKKGKKKVVKAEAKKEEEVAAAEEAKPTEPEPEVIEPDSLVILAAECVVEPPPTLPPGVMHSQALKGMVFVVSENIDVAGSPSTVGVAAWANDHAPATTTSAAVKKAVAAGATCLGKSSVQPGLMDMVGANFGNPLNKSRVTGGGCTGAAAAVASGMCDFALSTDILGETRIPAACCNLYSYRPTPALAGSPSASASASPFTVGGSSFEGLSVMSRAPATLIKVAEAIGVTGSTRLSGEIIKFVVAQDMFDLCAPELQPATVALKKAILKWAGTDQAGAVQLIRFLSTNTDEWAAIAKATPAKNSDVPLGPYLESTLAGVVALRDHELQRQYGDKDDVHGRVQMSVEVSESDNSVSVSLSSGAILPYAPSSFMTTSAQKLAQQVFDVMRQTVKPDTIMVLPCMPFPPPKRNSSSVEQEVFVKLCQVFNMVATMGACPTVTLPIGNLRDGSPVSIALFSVHKFDMRLLGVAQRLVPMLQDSFQSVKEEITQLAVKQQEAEAAALAAAAEAAVQASKGDKGSSKSAPLSKASAAKGADPSAVELKKVEKADKFKAKGNEFYQTGKFADAITEYTKAINAHPNSHVYYNNRAMACIKLFRFEQAEEDCNRALKLVVNDKDKVKALLRRATARDALQKYEDAEKDLRLVLNLEPNNKQAREDLSVLRSHKKEIQAAQAHAQAQAMQQQKRAQQAGGGAMPNGPPGMPGMGDGPVTNAQLQQLQQMMAQAQMNGGQGMPGMPGMGMPPGFDPSQFDPGMDYDPGDDYGDDYGEEY